MSYKWMYIGAIVVACLGALFTAIQNTPAEALGISQIAVNWTRVLSAPLIVLASILPSVRKPPSDEREGMD